MKLGTKGGRVYHRRSSVYKYEKYPDGSMKTACSKNLPELSEELAAKKHPCRICFPPQ